jgi:tetratricopeptide (TPR) repeat protein
LQEFSWAARKLFEVLAGDGSLVALIDDIHWAEPAFLELIEHVLDNAENASIMLLATSRHDLLEKRGEWGKRPDSLRLVLRPLTDAAAAQVAENLLGSTGLPPDVVKRITEAAEGNPLYLEQILSMLVDSKALLQKEGRWVRGEGYGEISIPPTIKALLEARLGQLGREERTAIEPASVIGLQFAAPAVASLAPEQVRPNIERHLAELTRKQFVHPSPSSDAEPIYRFHHHLVRDTVYGGLLKRARAVLHIDFVRWADQVNAERGRGLEFEEILGYHLEQAHRYLSELGPLDDKGREIGRDAARRLSSAGRRTFSRGDLRAAVNLLRRATALLVEDDPLRLTLLPVLGEALHEIGQFADSRLVVDEAQSLAERVANHRVKAAAQLLRLYGRMHTEEAGNWREATLQLTTEIIPALEKEEAHAELARAWRLIALIEQITGRFKEAGEAIAKIITHARQANDERLISRTAIGMTFNALCGPTPVTQALHECEGFIAGDLGDQAAQALIMCKLAVLRAMNHEPELARDLYHRARALLIDLGQSGRATASCEDIALIELLAGDAAAAEKAVRADYDAIVAMGSPYYLSSLAGVLARAVRDQGRDAEALELTKVSESAAAEDDVDTQICWRCVRAPILARAGDLVAAEEMARDALRRAFETQQPSLQAFALSELATVLDLSGRNEESLRLLEQSKATYLSKGDIASAGALTQQRATTR